MAPIAALAALDARGRQRDDRQTAKLDGCGLVPFAEQRPYEPLKVVVGDLLGHYLLGRRNGDRMTHNSVTRFAAVRIEVHEGPHRLAIAGLSSGGPASVPDVIWLHANGFNGRTYLNTLGPIADQLNILAIDQRGHGGTPQDKSAAGKTDALDMRDDLLALLDAVSPNVPVILSGHSMGGCVSLLAAAEVPQRIRALALFDPVILSRDATQRAMAASGSAASEAPMVAKTRSRRAQFPSRQAVFDSYQRRSIFSGWPEAALRDYVEAGFRDLPDGSVELACAPEWEAAIFAAHGHDVWTAMSKIECPVWIYRAEEGSTCAISRAPEFPRPPGQVRVHTVAGSTHFLPIERPDVVREALLDVVAATRV
jgi:pimeloyl-ACP methyl ester carboxylesterase